MRLLTHEKLVRRNVKIGRYAFTAGMILLLGAFGLNLYSLTRPQQPELVAYVFAAFLTGFILTSVGTVFQNRWGRRPDKGLSDALKGLDDRYALYNYRLGASHVLVGPGGAIVLLPKYQPGPITYANGKWQAPLARRGFLRLFSNDPLGNPAAEAAGEVEALNNFVKKRLPELALAPQALIVFMNPRAEVLARDSSVPALHAKQLKEHIRRLPKSQSVPPQMLAELEKKLGLAQA